MNRVRRIFGRVQTICPATGKEVRIELTREGLRVRAQTLAQSPNLNPPGPGHARQSARAFSAYEITRLLCCR